MSCIYLLDSMYGIPWVLYLGITGIEVTSLRQAVLTGLGSADRNDNLRQAELTVLSSVTQIEER